MLLLRSPFAHSQEATIKSVASEMVTNGMLAAGWDHINMDDCWGATNLQYPGGVRGDGPYHNLGIILGPVAYRVLPRACHPWPPP